MQQLENKNAITVEEIDFFLKGTVQKYIFVYICALAATFYCISVGFFFFVSSGSGIATEHIAVTCGLQMFAASFPLSVITWLDLSYSKIGYTHINI